MDVAIVTGAATGLGLAIARKLNDIGFRVYGLGGNYEETPYKHGDFIGKACNLADPKAVQNAIREIIKIEGNIFAIVNNAKIYTHKYFDETDVNELESIMRVNLLCPVVMVREALPSLCKFGGYFINIGPNKPEFTRGGPAGAAAAGGLYYLSESLFENYRDSGLKVTNIFPQINTHRPDKGPVPQKENPQSVIDVETVAKTVAEMINSRSGNLVTEMVIRPQRVVEDPTPPAYRIPYPKPKPLPRTTPREVIEQQDLEDMLADELPREPKKMSARKLRKPFEIHQAHHSQHQGDSPSPDSQRPQRESFKNKNEYQNGSESDDNKQDNNSKRSQKDRQQQNWSPRRKYADGNRNNENREPQEKPVSEHKNQSQEKRENKEFSKEHLRRENGKKVFVSKDESKSSSEDAPATVLKRESPKKEERMQSEAKAKIDSKKSSKTDVSTKKTSVKKSIPKKKTATKKAVAKKSAAKKSTKKKTTKKATVKKITTKKAATKKVAKTKKEN